VSLVNYSGVGALGLCLANDRTLHSDCDRTWSQVTYADVCECVGQRRSDAGVRPVINDLTHPIVKNHLWMLSGNDLTLGVCGEQRVQSWCGLSARTCVLTWISAFGPLDGASSLNLTRGAGLTIHWRSIGAVQSRGQVAVIR